jgi:single-stranded-DNA-specific exonuclease
MWTQRLYNHGVATTLTENGMLDIFSTIVAGRNNGIADKSGVGEYAAKKLSGLEPPYATGGMKKGVEAVRKILKAGGRNVAIFGDYDVDGITSSRICARMMLEAGFGKTMVFLPNRVDDGYGLNELSVTNFINKLTIQGFKPDLVMVLDCGTSSNIHVKKIKETYGVSVVVVDHHIIEEGEFSSAADAVINPRLENSHPFCTAGLMLQFARALLKKSFTHARYIAYAALGTVADVCFMQGSNRIIVYHGLQELKKTEDGGLVALMSACGVNREKIDEDTIGFSLAPTLNASGRLSDPMISYELVASDDFVSASDTAMRLSTLNDRRKGMQREIIESIEKKIEHGMAGRKSIVAVGNWHVGIVGIVAGQLAEKYHVPVLCFGTDEKGKITGSGRTKTGIHIKEVMDDCSEMFLRYGGHEMAAGATLNPDYAERAWDLFDAAVRRQLQKTGAKDAGIVYDFQLTLSQFRTINQAFCEKLALIGPFGQGNERPIFRVDGVKCKSVYDWKSGKGGQIIFNENDMDAFAMVPDLAKKVYGKRVNILFTIEKSFKDDVSWSIRVLHAQMSREG